jgi:hypothetical protein
MVGIFDPACEPLHPWMRNYTCGVNDAGGKLQINYMLTLLSKVVQKKS